MKKLTWEEYFLALVQITSLRSKDPNTKVGTIIVNPKNRIISTGYNGMPLGDDTFTWKKEHKDYYQTKYAYAIHAELNAILNSTRSVENSTLYTTLFPCSQCAKTIAQSEIKKVIYKEDKYSHTKDIIASKKIFDQCNVEYKQGVEISVEVKK